MTSIVRTLVLWCSMFTVAACATATPIAPAPIDPDQARSLRSALVGDWKWVAQQPVGGERSDMPSSFLISAEWRFHFDADGTMRFNNAEASWSLDGANIVTTTAFETLRAEEWTARELKLFWYGDSKFMYLHRQ